MRRRQRRQWRRNFRRRCLRSSSDGDTARRSRDRVQLSGPRGEGRKIGVMFSGMSSLLVMCHPALSRSTTACAPLATLSIRRVELHRGRSRHRKRQGRSDAPRMGRSRRTDRRCRSADRRVVLVSFRAWPTGGRGPFFLANTGFVLEPDFDRRRLGQPCEMSFQRAREVFKPLDDPLVLEPDDAAGR